VEFDMRIDSAIKVTIGNTLVNRAEINGSVVYRRLRTFTVRAKPYPQDGEVPQAQMEELGAKISGQIPRDWTFFVWDDDKNTWVRDLDYAGALLVDRTYQVPVPRYDTWDGAVRASQQQAFCNAIDALPDGKRIVIVASHAPENYNAAMATRIKRCGGSTAKLSWTARSSYILVGKTGLLEGNGYQEALNNIAYNGVSNCAEVVFSW
jgi:hypothetical protein